MVDESSPKGMLPVPQDPGSDGRPPAPDSPDRTYILTKISDCRKTCEWLAGLGIAYVLSAVIRASDLSPRFRHFAIPLAFAQILVAIVGAWPVTDEVNTAQFDALLYERFKRRRQARFVSISLLLIGLVVLSASVW
jgi:hypothetical protein